MRRPVDKDAPEPLQRERRPVDRRESLMALLGETLGERGFKLRKKDGAFARKVESGDVQTIHLSLIGRGDADFDVTVALAIRLDPLERLLDELSGADTGGSSSLGVDLGNLSVDRPRRWTIAADPDVPRAAESIQECLDTVGQAYFDRFGRMPVVFRIMSGDGPASWLHSPFHATRAIKAVALAHVLGEQDSVERLIEAKRCFLVARKDKDLDRFDTFVAQLRKKTAAHRH
jgi:hypothetical protein